MKHTNRYQLSQWEATDRLLMSDFNSDNIKLETAISEKCSVSYGMYTGTGTQSRSFTLSTRPRILLVFPQNGQIYDGGVRYGGLALPGYPAVVTVNGTASNLLEITATGFTVYCQGTQIRANEKDRVYLYFVLY